MTRSLSLGCVLGSVLALVGACNSAPEPGDTGNPSGTSGAGAANQPGGSGTANGIGGGSSGTSPGGSSSGGVTTAGTSAGGQTTTGGGGAASGGTGGTGTAPMGPFACTMYLGLLTTNEWYSKGFEEAGVDGTKWELKYHHFGYVRTWGDPNSAFWGETGDSFALDQGSEIKSPCATNPLQPDRMVFAALDWEMETKEEWVAALEMALTTFKGKYPSLKWIDIMTLIRCPMNMMCNPNADYGPGANPTAGRQDCYIPPYEDEAIAAVAAAHPDFVGVGPKVEANHCRQPVDGAHLNDDTNQQAAKDVAAYYKLHP